MPEISGVPNINPVSHPMMSPGEAARPGEVVSRLGEEGQQIAQIGSNLEEHLIEAQRQVSIKQGEIALGQYQNVIHDELRKATTPEDVDAIRDKHDKEWPSILEPFGKDHLAAQALNIHGQQQAVIMQNTFNGVKAKIITEADHVVNAQIGETKEHEGIASVLAGGNAEFARDEYELALRSSEVNGTLLPAQVDKLLQEFDQHVQTGAIQARANDPDPAKRQDLINQLRTGNGHLVEGLPEALRTPLLTAAELKDRELTNLAESQDLNTRFGEFLKYVKANPTLFSDPESMVPATANPEVLKAIGALTYDGKPDFVMGKKLLSFVEPLVANQEREALDKANRDRDEVYDLFSKGKLAQGMAKAREYLPDFEKAKRDDFPAIVNAAKSWASWERSEARQGRIEAREQRAEAKRDWQDRSTNTAAQIFGDIADGKRLDMNKDIWALTFGDKPQLTPPDARELEMVYKQSDQDKQFKAAMSYLATLPVVKSGTPESNKELLQMVQEWKSATKDLKPDEYMNKAEEIGESHSASKTWQWIENFFSPSAAKSPMASPVVATPSKPAPEVGSVVKGYRFKGGNPRDRTNWEKP